jgi:hypothetical protein
MGKGVSNMERRTPFKQIEQSTVKIGVVVGSEPSAASSQLLQKGQLPVEPATAYEPPTEEVCGAFMRGCLFLRD